MFSLNQALRISNYLNIFISVCPLVLHFFMCLLPFTPCPSLSVSVCFCLFLTVSDLFSHFLLVSIGFCLFLAISVRFCLSSSISVNYCPFQSISGRFCIPHFWFGLAFLRITLPCCDPMTNDLKSRVDSG